MVGLWVAAVAAPRDVDLRFSFSADSLRRALALGILSELEAGVRDLDDRGAATLTADVPQSPPSRSFIRRVDEVDMRRS